MCNFLKIWVGLSLAKIVVLRFYFRRCTFTVLLGNLRFLCGTSNTTTYML